MLGRLWPEVLLGRRRNSALPLCSLEWGLPGRFWQPFWGMFPVLGCRSGVGNDAWGREESHEVGVWSLFRSHSVSLSLLGVRWGERSHLGKALLLSFSSFSQGLVLWLVSHSPDSSGLVQRRDLWERLHPWGCLPAEQEALGNVVESDLGSRVARGEWVLLVHLPLSPSPIGAKVLGFSSLLTALELCPPSPSPCLPPALCTSD